METVNAAIEALRQALIDTEPDPDLRAEHATGCFTDNPRQTLCMVCGRALERTSGVPMTGEKL